MSEGENEMSGKVLLVDSCIGREESRTKRLADAYMEKRHSGDEIQRIVLEESDIGPLTAELRDYRHLVLETGDLQDPMFRYARQFAEADDIVIAAPYWDLGFPAILKCYIEQVMVTGVTYEYTPQGIPSGLCKARSLTYITTSGGYIEDKNFGFDYIRALCDMFGITDVKCFAAEGLDLYGADVDWILEESAAAF